MKKSIDKSRGRFVFVIPVYNHEGKITDVIKAAREIGLPVIVVNDGSTDSTPQILAGIKEMQQQAKLNDKLVLELLSL